MTVVLVNEQNLNVKGSLLREDMIFIPQLKCTYKTPNEHAFLISSQPQDK